MNTKGDGGTELTLPGVACKPHPKMFSLARALLPRPAIQPVVFTAVRLADSQAAIGFEARDHTVFRDNDARLVVRTRRADPEHSIVGTIL